MCRNEVEQSRNVCRIRCLGGCASSGIFGEILERIAADGQNALSHGTIAAFRG